MKWTGLFLCLTLLVAFFLMIPPDDAAAETYESFIRLHPHGPPGVGMKGDEKEKEHVYYTSPTNEVISAGVWDAVRSRLYRGAAMIRRLPPPEYFGTEVQKRVEGWRNAPST